jgi:uncharacterized protein YegL
MVADRNRSWGGGPFELQYRVDTPDILANLLHDEATSSFALMASPPPAAVSGSTPRPRCRHGLGYQTLACLAAGSVPRYRCCALSCGSAVAQNLVGRYAKHVVFLIDRSGSMGGDPMNQAKQALAQAIGQLTDIDFFNIVQFDHEQIIWNPIGPVHATAANRHLALTWVEGIQARGLTDILTPLQGALTMLENHPVNAAGGMGLPLIFLLTDGCVRDEREICQYVQANRKRTRIMTMGIGRYCNHYFLQMVAQMGHGFCELAYTPETIYRQMVHLVEMASLPVLTDVEVDIDGVDECELYPFPIPDLFVGAPLILSGQYTGKFFPPTVVLSGVLGNGQRHSEVVQVKPAGGVPVERVFLKQRLELMTAKAWLQNDAKMESEVASLSAAASMPCAYTTMICFETTLAKLNEFAAKQNRGGGGGGVPVVQAESIELFEVNGQQGGRGGVRQRRGLSNAALGVSSCPPMSSLHPLAACVRWAALSNRRPFRSGLGYRRQRRGDRRCQRSFRRRCRYHR